MKYTLPLLLLPLTALPGRASEADSVRSYRMDEVVVTATRAPLPLKSAPVLTRVIPAAEIRRSGIPTLQGLLEKELAGVEFHQAGYGQSLSFQGLDARYVLFLVDGERMAGETYGNIDYNRIPLSNIERIEIVRGASSVLYGSNAMGAVVNVITRMPRERVEVGASVRYGTPFQRNGGETMGSGASTHDLETYRDRLDVPNLRSEMSVGLKLNRFRSLTTASYRSVDAYRLSGTKNEERHYERLIPMSPDIASMMTGTPSFNPGAPVSDTTLSVPPDSRGLSVSGWRDWSVGQRFDYELSEQFRFELSGSYFRKQRFDFQNSIMDDNPLSAVFGNNDEWTFESYRGYNLKALMEHSPNRRNKIYLSYVRDEYRRDLDSLSGTRTPKQRHTYNIPRLLWTLEAGRSHRLTTGIEMTNEQLRFDLNADPRGFDDVKSMNTGSAYVQDEILTGHRVSFVVGVRGEYNDRFGWQVTPKASAKLTAGDFSVRANYSNGYRNPSLKEMYMELDIPVANSPRIIGNPGLKPEKNHYLSLCLEYDREAFNLSASVNQSYFRNKIDARRLPDEGTRQVMRYENIDRSRFGSIELIGRLRLLPGLVLNGNYNYVYQHDNAPEGSTQYIFPSPHTATFSLDYRFARKRFTFGAEAHVRYVGAKEYEDFMPYIEIPDALAGFIRDKIDGKPGGPTPEVIAAMRQFKYYTGTYTARHPSYAVCGVTLNAEWNRRVMLAVGGENLFDYAPQVVNFNSALTAPRNFFVQLSFRY